MNILEVIIAIVLIALMVDGYRLGLVKTLFSILKIIIGVVMAMLICTGLSGNIPSGYQYIVPAVFLAVIGIVMGILGAIERLINLVDKIPVARQLNRIAGIPAGLIKGIITIWILMAVLWYFKNTQLGIQIQNMIDSSSFLKFLFKSNPIQEVVLKWAKIQNIFSKNSKYFYS